MGGMADPGARFPGYRFPAVIIGEVVWLRFRFNLSLRDIPALMAARRDRGQPRNRARVVRQVRCGLRHPGAAPSDPMCGSLSDPPAGAGLRHSHLIM